MEQEQHGHQPDHESEDDGYGRPLMHDVGRRQPADHRSDEEPDGPGEVSLPDVRLRIELAAPLPAATGGPVRPATARSRLAGTWRILTAARGPATSPARARPQIRSLALVRRVTPLLPAH
jgi:hypothetical protein